MEARLDYAKAAPGGVRALYGLEAYLAGCGLEPSLRELVKLRASQINGCAYCIDMHTKDTRARGETEQRLYLLDAWRLPSVPLRPRSHGLNRPEPHAWGQSRKPERGLPGHWLGSRRPRTQTVPTRARAAS